MDEYQNQIMALSHRVDTLCEAIEKLSLKLSEGLSELKNSSRQETEQSQPTGQPIPRTHESQSAINLLTQHKDVLIDSNSGLGSFSSNSNNNISADIQVQRLTAQLTAAYNRIAALEEQLLAQRIHS
ncbi:MAG: hypothetical protein F6K50_37985 [Moorea sp. SIO3I7]|uniref:hypothetical protein n=2 Tax=unclassified Moorena TaxID=2683338 RepID=UPI0013CD4427|nr:hypothetical protein [Moorena sp. SIO3E8]NEO01005.1 hypothetical protein [Moorena sp. SIO3I7]NEO47224.1 hypothetical protein [Moorena sp. SIO4A3]NEO59459.1 hypothetical protein [Moorena sp. SIO4G2]NEQ01551.1 hypothetical protein [Moorena sp. SIO3F7]NEO15795.1 hypothetical protein [Moorena sp. SIO3E8]